jgi:hypothetical protein
VYHSSADAPRLRQSGAVLGRRALRGLRDRRAHADNNPVGRPSTLTRAFIAAAYEVINHEDDPLICSRSCFPLWPD